MSYPKKKVAEDLFEGDYDNRDVLYWADEKEYTEEYFGDTYKETTRFDDDWN